MPCITRPKHYSDNVLDKSTARAYINDNTKSGIDCPSCVI